MAGYIGSKAVNLSTTSADVTGDADIGGALDVGGAFTSQGIDDNATATAMTIASDGSVGIGSSSPSAPLTVQNFNDVTTNTAEFYNDNGNRTFRFAQDTSGNATQLLEKNDGTDAILLNTNGNSYFNGGNLLVGTTSAGGADGITLYGAGVGVSRRTGNVTHEFRRDSTDGNIVEFSKDGTTVGSVKCRSSGGNLQIDSVQSGIDFGGDGYLPMRNGSIVDNDLDIGSTSYRFDDIYVLSVISTSDRNEKQDIAELTDAEQRVAVAAKGLLRKFRWKNRVAEKGDEARTHFGIIAQDLQAAFAAEGLDAGDYAMFISTTWWETQTEVPAVEAVAEVTEITTDEDGNEVVTVVTEAVEAKDAYTRTDTYETAEEAPEGATERTRLGVRYSELLAFIIGAL